MELVIKEENCSCSTRYLSVVGKGTAFLVCENEEKKQALNAIMVKYTGRIVFDYPVEHFEKTLIIKVEIESMTGKRSGY